MDSLACPLLCALGLHTYVPFVLDIGETLQYLFAEREESKEHFVREYGCCMLVCYIMCMHFIALVFSVLR